MSKKLLYLLGILLTIIVGTILHWYFSCDCAVRSGNGTSRIKIACASKDPDESIADKNTPEGKAKHRRTVILIK
jgi:OOP family OmpA-OmpF porin